MNHFFTVAFVEKVLKEDLVEYHKADKKVPFFDRDQKKTVKPESNNGVKLEAFIFDVFPLGSLAIVD